MSVRFDNNADFLEKTTILPSNTTFSACGLGYLTSDTNNFQTFWQYDNGASQYVSLATHSDGTTMKVFTGSTSTNLLALSVGVWYFFGVSVTGGNATAYAGDLGSGALTSQTIATGTTTGLNDIRIGNNQLGTTERWDGRIQNVRVWDGVALSAAEMEAERRLLRPRRFPGLFCWLPMLNAGLAGTDWSGQGNSFTTNGTLTSEDGPPLPWSQRGRRLILPAAAVVGGATGHYYRRLTRVAAS